MKKKKYLYFSVIVGVLMLISIVMALIPPPPADQNLGIYDTVYGNFVEDECRACHNSGVPDTHHMLVPDEGYECLDCHTLGPGGGIGDPTRDCLVCHLASPHHNTTEAQDRHCSHCHGSLVDDYDDGHSIPTYDASLITPDTSFREENATTGKKWGGCEACHEANTTPVPGAAIDDNYITHHNIWPGDDTKCYICHNMSSTIPIRQCEDCHGVKSLHNIQYDYNTTNGLLGYGHIGDNWDCMGCHAWYEAYSLAPQTGPIVPCIDGVSPAKLVAGEETVVTITGTNFRNTVNGIDFTSDVVIDTCVETMTLVPDSITASEIMVTIPVLDKGSYVLYVVKDVMKSKLMPIVVVPPVAINSVTIEETNVVISGTGFGEYESSFAEWIGVTIEHTTRNKKKTVTLDCSIVSWSDVEVVVNCQEASGGDLVTVDALYGSDSAEITSDEPGKPPKKPKK